MGKEIEAVHNRQLYRRSPSICPCPYDLDLWLFDLGSDVWVTCDFGYLCANFSIPRPPCYQLRPDVCDSQTDVRLRQHHRLVPPPGVGHNNNNNTYCWLLAYVAGKWWWWCWFLIGFFVQLCYVLHFFKYFILLFYFYFLCVHVGVCMIN